MTLKRSLKTFGIAVIAVGLTGGVAYAGAGKDCGDKHKTTMNKDASMSDAKVLGAKAETGEYKAKKKMKALTFDEAVKLCTEKQVADLQACVDKKTAQYKPES